MNPAVSVCMIVYNGEKYIRTAIDSVLSQTFSDLELIVVDDGSSDSTPDILAECEDPRLRVIRQENQRQPRARSRAFAEARGEFIAGLDADDLAYANRLERQCEFLRAHPDIAMVASDFQVIDKHGNPLWIVRLPSANEELRRLLFRRNLIPPSAVMLRKNVFEAVGDFDSSIPHNDDYDYWLRIALRFKLASLPEVLCARRAHEGQTLMTKTRGALKGSIEVRRRAIETFGLPWYYHLTYVPYYGLMILPRWFLRALRKFLRRRRTRRGLRDLAGHR